MNIKISDNEYQFDTLTSIKKVEVQDAINEKIICFKFSPSKLFLGISILGQSLRYLTIYFKESDINLQLGYSRQLASKIFECISYELRY